MCVARGASARGKVIELAHHFCLPAGEILSAAADRRLNNLASARHADGKHAMLLRAANSSVPADVFSGFFGK
jgi:hypothetical protein